MSRAVRLDYQGPLPSTTATNETPSDVRGQQKSRKERFEEAQKKILSTYAETFRRLAE
jgi:hypothetical protein